MFFFVIRRLLVSIPILLASSFAMFGLVTISGDPLEQYRQSTDPNREQTMATVRRLLELDKPFTERYIDWVTGLFSGDFGVNREGQQVSTLLSQAVGTTFRLIILATVISILLGIIVGVVSAVRQYSAIDYSSTFAAFLFFSLPVFWVAVLLKEFGAIRFNDYLEEPGLSTGGIVFLSVLGAIIVMSLVPGSRSRRLSVAAVGGALIAGALFVIDATDWLSNPGISLVGVVLLALVAAVLGCGAFAELSNTRVMGAAVVAALAGVAGSVILSSWVEDMSWTRMTILFVATVATGIISGAVIGGEIDRDAAMRAGATTTVLVGLVIVFDQLISAWEPGRTVATIGPSTPNLDAPFWETMVDYAGHQVLPSAALALIGFATFMRFTRSSMLETLESDYVRTAKAKGLPPMQVILRHAFRTALIPVMTVITISFATAIDGAVITERVFAWQGMGTLFIDGLNDVDPYPVMGFLVVSSLSIVIMNAFADILYAYLDPRIRR